jgi:DNA-binding IclR family transcriptional regulator
MTDAEGDDDRYMVPALERGLSVLRCFTWQRPQWSLAELTHQLGLPRPSVFRLVHTLETLGYLVRDDTAKRYRLGSAVLNLGFEYLASVELPDLARHELESLRDRTGASTHLAIREGREIVYLSRYASRTGLTSTVRVGTRLDAHATTMGRVLLAGLSDVAVTELYRDRTLARHTDQTPGTIREILALLDGDRRRGYVIGRSFYERGVVSIAAPLRDTMGRTVAAISLTIAEPAVDAQTINGDLRYAVCEAAAEISRGLGHPHSQDSAAE